MSSILLDVVSAANEEQLEEHDLEEEIEDSKLNFQVVTNEVKAATQEAISSKTISAYRGYSLLSNCMSSDPKDFPYQLLINIVCGTSFKNMFMTTLVTKKRNTWTLLR